MKFSVNRSIKSLLQFGVDSGVVRGLSILWLIAICWLAFFRHLGSIGLIDETEPLFAEAARQMTVTGDWVTPFFNGETRFDKPPLIYWLMAIAYQIFGVNEWAARLPSALAALALTSFCFCALWRFGPPTSLGQSHLRSRPTIHQQDLARSSWVSAWLGAAIFVFNPYTFFWGRVGYSDMLLNACLGGALLAFFFGYAHPERQVQVRWYLICYTLIALAVLTKGPVGIVLPGLIIGCFLLYLGKGWEVLREMQVLPGALIVLGLTVPWYVLVILANGRAYIDSFFGYHNLERFTSVVNQHSGPWYFHILVVLVGFIPWSVYLPAAIARIQVLNRRNWQAQPRSSHLGLFALVWFLVVLSFFTIAATKYFSYVLPLMPVAAILIALLWSDQITQAQTANPERPKILLSNLFNLGLFLALAVVSIYSPNWLGDDPSMPDLGLRLQQTHLPVLGAVVWVASAIAGGVLLLRRRANWLWSVNLVGYVAFLVFVITPALFIVDAERQLPLRQIAQTAVEVERPGEELFMVVNGFPKPSLVFYTQQPVTYLSHPSEVVSSVQIAKGHSTSNSALVVASHEALKQTGLKPNQYQAISHAGIYQLVRLSSNLK